RSLGESPPIRGMDHAGGGLRRGAPDQPGGTQTFRFWSPPPEDLQPNASLANSWQYAVSSWSPMTSGSQDRKQRLMPDSFSKGEQIWGWSVSHSPGATQQSSLVSHWWVQYPPSTLSRHSISPTIMSRLSLLRSS